MFENEERGISKLRFFPIQSTEYINLQLGLREGTQYASAPQSTSIFLLVILQIRDISIPSKNLSFTGISLYL